VSPAHAALPLLDRDRSILAFNRRVLDMVRRADVPLMERLRYLCIVSSNLDEFFEIRFADALQDAQAAASASMRNAAHSSVLATAAEAHAQRTPGFALGDLRPEDAGAILALEGKEVAAGIEHGHGERLQLQRAPMLERPVDDERGLRKGEGGHG